MVVIATILLLVVIGCSEKESPIQSTVGEQGNIPSEARQQTAAVRYSGTETLEEMLQNYYALRDSGVVPEISAAEEQEMVAAFIAHQNQHQAKVATSQTIIAYAAYYYYSGHDYDLRLEYKWWAGSQQGYYFTTPNWALYWAIRACYGGHITSWSWMEGGYQRVTGVVGSCLYSAFGAGYIRYYLRVKTY